VCERDREFVCLCVYVCVCAREETRAPSAICYFQIAEGMTGVCVRERDREREAVCVYVCVCVGARAKISSLVAIYRF